MSAEKFARGGVAASREMNCQGVRRRLFRDERLARVMRSRSHFASRAVNICVVAEFPLAIQVSLPTCRSCG